VNAMPKPSTQKLIAEATTILNAAGVSIRRDRSVRYGGCCTVDGKNYLVIGALLPAETVLELLLEGIRTYQCSIDHCSTALASRLNGFARQSHPPSSE
jgi:hypothetical protein